MGKRKRVPDVLWKVYNNKARSLSEAIVSLIPTNCDCHSRGKCLRCVFGNSNEVALSYLIRSDDPREYKQLMMTCFVVVPQDAPPFPPLVSFSHRWTQLQVVKRAIETFLSRKAATSNVICCGYLTLKNSSPIVKLLTNSTWELTLTRVGDNLMDYLLIHTMMFMPIRSNAHQQVTGSPVNGLFSSYPICMPDHGSSMHATRTKRKRRTGDVKESVCEASPTSIPFKACQHKLFDCVGSRKEDCVGTHLKDRSCLLHVPEASELINDHGLHRGDLLEEQPCKKLKVKPDKRFRLPSWQRRKRRKTLTLQNDHTTDLVNDDSSGDTICTSDEQLDNEDETDENSKRKIPLPCPCCSVLRSLSPVPEESQINRKFIFYGRERSSHLFPKNHVLYSLKPGFAGADELLQHILGSSSTEALSLPTPCFHNSRFCLRGSPCLYHSFVKLLKEFLKRAKRCQYKRLLRKHSSAQLSFPFANGDSFSVLQNSKMELESGRCKQGFNQEVNQSGKRSLLTDSRNRKRTSEVIQHHFGLSQPYCLKDEVVSFVWAVCRNVIPPDLLGVPSNRRILRRNISRFIRLRRFEKFSLKQCLHKVQISKFPMLSNKQSFRCFNASLPDVDRYALTQTLLQKWVFWIFNNVVVPLIEANFHVTESENGKQNIYYYRKSAWKKLSDRVTSRLKVQNYRSLNFASLRSILDERSFGFSKVWLCPKETGARPIANLRAPSRLCSRKFYSHGKKRKRRSHKRISKITYFKAVNTVLRDVHAVFKDLKMKEPEKWGSSVSSYGDIYKKLCPFLRDLKKENEAMPTVYVVVSDVQRAFDTVNQDKLLAVLNEIEMADKLQLQQSSEIFCRKKFFWVTKNIKLGPQGLEAGQTAMVPSIRQKSCHTVLVNQGHSKTVKKEELKFILKEHLKRNVIKLGKRFFVQVVGIPQGSVLSSLLCSLYYGHLERNVIFPLLAKVDRDDNSGAALDTAQEASTLASKYLLLRLVDDFLFITTSKKQAASFFSRLQRGFREYNCYMNQEKFCTNFDVGRMPGLDSKRRVVLSDGTSFLCWSGLLINSSTLEVQADYTRYLNEHLSSSLNVSMSCDGRHTRQLKAKLCAYMRPKCHPLFFDTTINSPATIRLNVYQAFVLCAMKFHCYVRELSTWCKLHPTTCLTSIEGSLRYMYNLMKRRIYGVNRDSNCHPVLPVPKEEVMWLGITAYIRVLNKKQSRYRQLLHLLRAALKPLSAIGHSPQLKYAVDNSHSSFMWKIKY